MLRDSTPVPIRQIAKDGADLPANQQIEIERSRRMGVGETADFTFTPTEPGEYELYKRVNSRVGWRQKWIVADPTDGD